MVRRALELRRDRSTPDSYLFLKREIMFEFGAGLWERHKESIQRMLREEMERDKARLRAFADAARRRVLSARHSSEPLSSVRADLLATFGEDFNSSVFDKVVTDCAALTHVRRFSSSALRPFALSVSPDSPDRVDSRACAEARAIARELVESGAMTEEEYSNVWFVKEAPPTTPSSPMSSPSPRPQTSSSPSSDQQVHHLLSGHRAGINACALSPSGRTLISASDDGSLRSWDLHHVRTPPTIFRGHDDAVVGVDVTRKNACLALTSSDDETLRLWTVSNGSCLATLKGHTDSVRDCAFMDQQNRAVSVSFDTTLRLWDLSRVACVASLAGHRSEVNACATSGHVVLTASDDGSLFVWDFRIGRIASRLVGHDDWVTSCDLGPSGSTLAVSGSVDRTIRLWDMRTFRSVSVWRDHDDAVRSCRFSPDCRHVVSGSSDQTARTWQTQTGRTLRVLRGHVGDVSDAVFSPSRTIVTASYDRTLRVWSGEETTGPQHARSVSSGSGCPRGGLLPPRARTS